MIFIIRFLKIVLLVLVFSSSAPNRVVSYNLVSQSIDDKSSDKLLTIALTGDIMLGSFYPDSSDLPKNEGELLLRYMKKFLKEADIACGNLEGVFADTGGTIKSLKYPDSAYYFKMPVQSANHLKEAGFDFLSLANNHIFDFGPYGKNMTKKTLDDVGIAYAGLTEAPVSIIEKDNVKYGFIAFAPNSGTLNMKFPEKAAVFVEELAAMVDVVIVSFHGGGEGFDYKNVTRETEIYMGENRGNVYEFTHLMVDAGADVVFGHGPHQTRAIELYNNRIIFYSLGNFCTYGRINKISSAGISPLVIVSINKSGVFQQAEVIPTKQIGKGVPVYDHSKKVINELQKLTAEDFPETLLSISDDGFIMRK